ncbi:MAG TPA: hypothetical protein VFY93_08940 [Planctomycetota bacterium]|nr:hypothetical protein [Planctomycetota bacterium]
MKRILPLLLSALVLVSCGSGDSFTPTPEQQALADCTGLSLEELGEIYGEVLDLLDSLGGVIPPNATYDIANGDYTIALSFGTLAGVVSSPNNLVDGLGVGETATATWALNGGLAGAPTVTGEGSFTVARPTSTTFNTSGTGQTVDGTCSFDFSGLNLSTTVGAGPVGTINFVATAPEGTLDGTITFNGSTVARVIADFDGKTYAFYIDLITYEITF